MYLASNSEIKYDPWPLISRFKQYRLKNQLVTKDYIYDRLTSDKVKQTLLAFKENQTALINTDKKPVVFWYQNLSWLYSTHPGSSGVINFFGRINLTKLIIGSILIFFALYYILDVLVQKKERILATLTIIPKFSLMAAEIIFIFLFQTIYGYLYYQLSLIFTAVLLGMAAGAWLSNFLVSRNKAKYAYLFRLYCILSLYFVGLALTISFLPEALTIPAFFYWLVFFIGFLTGMEFPLVNKFYLRLKLEPAKKTGTIYGVDMIGSSLGAILTSILFLPILGFTKTIIFLALLNFLAFMALFFLRQNFEES